MGAIESGQRKRIHALKTELGWDDDKRRQESERIVGCESTKQMSKAQADTLISYMEGILYGEVSEDGEVKADYEVELPEDESPPTSVEAPNLPAVVKRGKQLDPFQMTRPPAERVEEVRQIAQALMSRVNSKKDPVKINNKVFIEFGDWQFIGAFFNTTARLRSVEFVEYDKAKGFNAVVDIVNQTSGDIMATGDSMCLDDEKFWKYKPLNQLKSMAQTRAGAKGFRMLFGWIAEEAGCASTPAEEMQEFKQDNNELEGKSAKSTRASPNYQPPEPSRPKPPPMADEPKHTADEFIEGVDRLNNKKDYEQTVECWAKMKHRHTKKDQDRIQSALDQTKAWLEGEPLKVKNRPTSADFDNALGLNKEQAVKTPPKDVPVKPTIERLQQFWDKTAGINPEQRDRICSRRYDKEVTELNLEQLEELELLLTRLLEKPSQPTPPKNVAQEAIAELFSG